MSQWKNPFALIIKDEPDDAKPGDAPHHAEVTIPVNGIVPEHYHTPGPDGEYDHSHIEVYHWLGGGALRMFIRENEYSLWRRLTLCEANRTVAILGGWHHGGFVSDRKPCVFRAISRTDHFRPLEKGGNVHRVPADQLPREMLDMMRMQQLVQRCL